MTGSGRLPPTRLVLAALAIVVVLVVAGLVLSRSGDDGAFAGDPRLPEGFTTFRTSVGGQELSFAYPRDWGEVEQGSDRSATTLEAAGERSDEDTRPFIQARVLPDSDASFEATFETNKQVTRLSGGTDTEIAEEREVDLPGAEEARLVEFRFDTQTGGGGTEPARLVALFAKSGNVFVSFGVGAPQSTGVDPGRIVESFRLHE